MGTDHKYYQKVGIVQYQYNQSDKQLLHILYNIQLTILPACWIFILFCTSHGIFFHFDKCNICLVSMELVVKAAIACFQTPSLPIAWFAKIYRKNTKKYSHALYIYARKMGYSQKAKKDKKQSILWFSIGRQRFFSHMTCFKYFPSFLPQYFVGSNRLLVSSE